MKPFSCKLQLYLLIIVYVISTVLTILFEFYWPAAKRFLYKEVRLDPFPTKKTTTYWQIAHFLTRVILGFVAPNYWPILILIDVDWEVLEWTVWQNHDWADIAYNIIGIIIGIGLNKIVTKN